jgi:hypothetical protein
VTPYSLVEFTNVSEERTVLLLCDPEFSYDCVSCSDSLYYGSCLLPKQVLADELADPKFRGFTICIIMTFGSIGVMAITSLGTLWPWRSVAGVTTAVFLLSVLPLMLLPESPSWLVRKGRLDEAARSLKWLWGPGREMEVSQLMLQRPVEFVKHLIYRGKSWR